MLESNFSQVYEPLQARLSPVPSSDNPESRNSKPVSARTSETSNHDGKKTVINKTLEQVHLTSFLIMASKIACIGLALVGAVSGFSFNGAASLSRVPARSSLSCLSMSGIGNTKSVKPDDSRRGGRYVHEIIESASRADLLLLLTNSCFCFIFSHATCQL